MSNLFLMVEKKMEVERLSLLNPRLKLKQDKRKTGAANSGQTSSTVFADILKKTSDETSITAELTGELPALNGTETLETLLDEVHMTGEELKRNAVFSHLSSYKTAVRRFMQYIIEKSIGIDEVAGIRNPQTMQQKKYVLLKVIDKKLENLATHILKNQADQLSILQNVDEINGLLVDIAG